MKKINLICPVSRQDLFEIDGKLQTQDGKFVYSITNNIPNLLPAEQLNYTVIIPARLKSTRLENKLLLTIKDKPLIEFVAIQALKSKATQVIVATDDQSIVDALQSLSSKEPRLKVILTSTEHQSGTSRLAQVIADLNINPDHIIVNLQGDEPLVEPVIIEQVAQMLAADPSLPMATLSTKLEPEDYANPNAVKVITNVNKEAIYFSRSLIPFIRNNVEDLGIEFNWQKHIGIYGYRANFVSHYLSLPPSPLEQIESLEQLRAIYYSYPIKVEEALVSPQVGVDTAQDFAIVKSILENNI